MSTITSALNYTPSMELPVLPKDNFNPDFTLKNLQSLSKETNQSGMSDLEKFMAKDNKIDFTPTSFNHDLYKRYTDSFFGNSTFLDPRYYNNEEINAKRQSEWNRLTMGSIKMLPMFYSSFASFFTSAPWNYDNENTRELEKISKSWEDLFPNFYSEAELTSSNPIKGIIPFVNEGWGNFWGDKMIKNLGFMGGALAATILTDAVITATTAGLGTIPGVAASTARFASMMGRLGKGFEIANTMPKVLAASAETGKFAMNTLKLANMTTKEAYYLTQGLKNIGTAKSYALNFWAANAEASIEAVGGNILAYDKAFNDFRARNGRLPTQEEERVMKEFVTASGNVRYAFNVAVIGASNMVQFGNLFSRTERLTTGMLGRSWEKGIAREVGGNTIIDPLTGLATLKAGSKYGKYVPKFGGKEVLADNISEGLQEISQFSFEKAQERSSDKQYKNFIEGKYDPNSRYLIGDIISSQVYGMKEAFSSKEGWESFFIGFLTGYPIAGGKALYNKIKGNPTQSQIEQKSIDTFNEASLEDLFKTNPEVQELLKRDGLTFDELAAQQWISTELKKAMDSGDVFAAKNLKLDALINMVRSAVQLGKFDARLVQLETLKNLATDSFEERFGIKDTKENRVAANSLVDSMMKKAKEIEKVVEIVDNSWENVYSFKDNPKEYHAFEMLKENFIRYSIQIESMANRIPKVLQDIFIAQPNLTTDVLDALANPDKINEKLLKPITEKRDNLVSTHKSILSSLDQEGIPSEQRTELTKQLKENGEKIDKIDIYLKDINDAVIELNAEYKKRYAPGELEGMSNEDKLAKEQEVSEKNNQLGKNRTILTKNLLEKILLYKINENGIDDTSIALQTLEVSKLDDIMNSIMDLSKLNNSMGLMMNEKQKMRTKAGQREYVEKYVGVQKFSEDMLFEGIKKASYKEMVPNAQEHADAARAEVVEHNKQLDLLILQREEIEKALKEKQEELASREEELVNLKNANTLKLIDKLNVEKNNLLFTLEESTGLTTDQVLEFQRQLKEIDTLLESLSNGTVKESPSFNEEAEISSIETDILPVIKEEIIELQTLLTEIDNKIKDLQELIEGKKDLIEQLLKGNQEFEVPKETKVETKLKLEEEKNENEIDPEEEIKKKLEEQESLKSGTQIILSDIDTQLTDEELIAHNERNSSLGELVTYSYMKTTQLSDLTHEERIEDKSGIFEQFISKYSSKIAFNTFLSENNLSIVMIRVPSDQGLQDDKYFSSDPKFAPKDSDSMFAVVYNDKDGNPTNKIAFLRAEEDVSESTSVEYEVIPYEEGFDKEGEMLLQRGLIETNDTSQKVRIVSIVQSVKSVDKDPQDATPSAKVKTSGNSEFDKMVNTRVELKLSPSVEEAKAYVVDTKRQMRGIRERIGNSNEIVPLEIETITIKTIKI